MHQRRDGVSHLHVREQAPQDTEQETLQAIRHQSGGQTAPEKRQHALLRDDLLGSGDYGVLAAQRPARCTETGKRLLTVPHVTLVDLTIGLNDAETVADRVGGDGRDEANERLALRCQSPPADQSLTKSFCMTVWGCGRTSWR